MKKNTNFPHWISESVHKNRPSLNPASYEFFEKFLEIYPFFSIDYMQCPTTIDIGVLKSHSLKELDTHYKKETICEFVLFNLFETFHFFLVYQVRELSLTIFESWENGKFFSASILNRSMFELVCVSYYSFRRVEKKFKEAFVFVDKINKTKSQVEKTRLANEYASKLMEIFLLIRSGNNASSIDWSSYMSKFGVELDEQEKIEKIHIMKAVEDIEKVSTFPLTKIYGMMSEFVHPNYGSKTLIIKTKRTHDKFMDRLTIGDNGYNEESALFYVDHCSEGLYVTLTLAMSLLGRSSDLLLFLNQILEKSENPPKSTIH